MTHQWPHKEFEQVMSIPANLSEPALEWALKALGECDYWRLYVAPKSIGHALVTVPAAHWSHIGIDDQNLSEEEWYVCGEVEQEDGSYIKRAIISGSE